MASLEGDRKERVSLVAAAHRFTLSAVPFRHPESEDALAAFVAAAGASRRPAPELDALCLHTLAALNQTSAGRIPTLVDRYLAFGLGAVDALARFRYCVEELLRFRGLRNTVVQRVIAIIDQHHDDPALSLAVAAVELRRSRTALASLFKVHTGRTFHGYLREVRLARAAALLTTTEMRVKEVWAVVGYNDGSDFDHGFRDRFGMSPREYRSRTMRPSAPAPQPNTQPASCSAGTSRQRPTSVVIVEDDDVALDTLQRYLTLEGHVVHMASTGEEGVSVVVRTGPEVLLLDLHLPAIDGLECLRRVRQQRGLRQPSVALMTGDWEACEHAVELAALNGRLVLKPCFLEDVGTLVAALGVQAATRPAGFQT